MKHLLASSTSNQSAGVSFSRRWLKLIGVCLMITMISACANKPPPPPPRQLPPPKNPLPELPQPDQIEHVNPDEDPSVLPRTTDAS